MAGAAGGVGMDAEVSPFSGRLLPGERVVWSGRPATGMLFTPRDLFLIPLSAVWLGFAVV